MRKNIRWLMYFVLLVLVGCGSGGVENEENIISEALNTTKMILASNVIIGEAEAAEGVDTTTKVLARNVMIDPKLATISSENVQDAFTEIKPDLATLLTSTPWKAYGYFSCNMNNKVVTENGMVFNDGIIEMSGDEINLAYDLNGASYEVIGNSVIRTHAGNFFHNIIVIEATNSNIILSLGTTIVFKLVPHDGSPVEGTGETACSPS